MATNFHPSVRGVSCVVCGGWIALGDPTWNENTKRPAHRLCQNSVADWVDGYESAADVKFGPIEVKTGVELERTWRYKKGKPTPYSVMTLKRIWGHARRQKAGQEEPWSWEDKAEALRQVTVLLERGTYTQRIHAARLIAMLRSGRFDDCFSSKRYSTRRIWRERFAALRSQRSARVADYLAACAAKSRGGDGGVGERELCDADDRCPDGSGRAEAQP